MSDLSQLFINQNNPYTLYVQNVVTTGNTGSTGGSISWGGFTPPVPGNTGPQPVNLAITNNFSSNIPTVGFFPNAYFYMEGDTTLQTISTAGVAEVITFTNSSGASLNILSHDDSSVSFAINGVYRVFFTVSISFNVGANVNDAQFFINYNQDQYAIQYLANLSNGGVATTSGSAVVSGMALINANLAPSANNVFSIATIANVLAGSYTISNPLIICELISPINL